MKLNNIKMLAMGKDLNTYQRALAMEELKALEDRVKELEAICTNVGELVSTMEAANLQTAWHILDNAGFTKNHKKAPPGGGE